MCGIDYLNRTGLSSVRRLQGKRGLRDTHGSTLTPRLAVCATCWCVIVNFYQCCNALSSSCKHRLALNVWSKSLADQCSHPESHNNKQPSYTTKESAQEEEEEE